MKSRVFLAPLAGVTDRAFREVCRLFFHGSICSEMVSINALYYKNYKTFEILQTESEDICQIFGRDAERLEAVADILNEQPCSAIDINCGCPAPKITSNGEGSHLMREMDTAETFIRTAVRVLNKPVTVKFRLGWDYDHVNCVEFAQMCEAAGASRVCLHARTRSQMYEGNAQWQYIKQVVDNVHIPVVGNGDVRSAEDAIRMVEETGCSGVMIGRGAMGNPWLLGDVEKALARYFHEEDELNKAIAERRDALDPCGTPGNPGVDAYVDGHADFRALSGRAEGWSFSRYETAVLHFQKLLKYKEKRAVLEMRKHAAWYMKNIAGAARLRKQINTATNEREMMEALEYLKNT